MLANVNGDINIHTVTSISSQVLFYTSYFCMILLVTQLQNLHHFSNLRDSFRFNAVSHR